MFLRSGVRDIGENDDEHNADVNGGAVGGSLESQGLVDMEIDEELHSGKANIVTEADNTGGLRAGLAPYIRQVIREEVNSLMKSQPVGRNPTEPFRDRTEGYSGRMPEHYEIGHRNPHQNQSNNNNDFQGDLADLARTRPREPSLQQRYQRENSQPPVLSPMAGDYYVQRPIAPRQEYGNGGIGDNRGHFSRMREDLTVKVRPFDQKEVDWYSYKIHFEGIAAQAGWSQHTRVTKLMGALQGSMTGIIAGLPQPIVYSELVSRIDGVYGISSAKEDAQLKLQNCNMDSAKETMSLFAERVRQLVERAYPTYTAIDREEQALRVFLQGLPTRYDMRMQMRLRNFTTFREAIEYGSRLEQILKDERQQEGKKIIPSRIAQSDKSDNLEQMVENLTKEVARLSTEQKQRQAQRGNRNNDQNKYDRQKRPCLLCGELGHWCKECPLYKKQLDNVASVEAKSLPLN